MTRNVVQLGDTGHVPTDTWMETTRGGLYAVGDIRQDSARQAIAAAGDGATAAIAAADTSEIFASVLPHKLGLEAACLYPSFP